MVLICDRSYFNFEHTNKLAVISILADKRIPPDAAKNLEAFGKIIYFASKGVTYPAISGHPDVFFCNTGSGLVFAPNAAAETIHQLKIAGCKLIQGKIPVGQKHPETTHYNAVVTDRYLIHNLQLTDPVLMSRCQHLQSIHVNQAYTGCNLIALPDGRFLTSDRGIQKALELEGLKVLYISPDGILLPGQKHGFIGGTCGMMYNKVVFIGSLQHFHQGEEIRNYLHNFEIVELYEGPLFDGGGIFFLA